MTLSLKKSLGQNFLVDNRIINLIVNVGNIQKNDLIIEVGPGKGALTEIISQKNPTGFTVIEKDLRLVKILEKKFEKKINIINQDMMDVVYENIYNKNVIIFGNLPYNISTQILAKWIKMKDLDKICKRLILMFQKEVADRIIAKVNTSNYGRLSIISNWKLDIKKVCEIKPQSFFPKPKINSSLILFKPKKNFHKIKNPKNLEKITRTFFNQRRKMIKKPYNQLFNGNLEIAKSLNIDLKLRPQNLDLNKYFQLTNEYEKLIS